MILGCSSDKSPTRPEIVSPDALLQPRVAWQGKADLNSMWPNEDTRSWAYDQKWGSCGFNVPPVYPDPESVPPAPPIEEIIPLVASGSAKGWLAANDGSCLESKGIYRLQFMGEITTASGVTAQNLVASHEFLGGDRGRRAAADNESTFLARRKHTRPDLFGATGKAMLDGPPPMDGSSVLLPGGPWRKSSEAIVLFVDGTQDPAWQCLIPEVKPGSDFRFQLVSDLADDVFLNAFVVPRSQQRKLKGYQREIEVVYLVDYGVGRVVGPDGSTLGYIRLIDYGSVVYVPGVGPVSALERYGATSDDLSRTTQYLSLELDGKLAGGFVPRGEVAPVLP